MNEWLGSIGFRRSQNVSYLPRCAGCKACVSVRVVTQEFRPNATQRKLLRRNEDLVVTACKPWSTEEQLELIQRYLKARHPGGGMTELDEMDFADMGAQTPVDSYEIGREVCRERVCQYVEVTVVSVSFNIQADIHIEVREGNSRYN